MSTSDYDDAGQTIYRERAAPHVSGPMLALANPSGTSTNSPFQNNLTFYSRFILDMEAGVGTGGIGANAYTTAWVAQASVVVTHNLGTTAVIVEVMDSTGLVSLPDSITVSGPNTVVLEFGAAFTGSCMVIDGTPGVTSYTQAFAGTTAISIPHFLNSNAVLVQAFSVEGLAVQPESITILDPNHVQLDFGSAFTGSVVVVLAVYTAAWVAQTAVIATHNLGTTAVEVQCYSALGLQVNPETMRVTSINTVALSFAEAFTGYVVIFASINVGEPFIVLDWSDDGGHTFGVEHSTSTGLPGAYATRVVWRRLGSSPDRVFRVHYIGGGKVAWINAYLESTAGSR
jgi:hypothetical protein